MSVLKDPTPLDDAVMATEARPVNGKTHTSARTGRSGLAIKSFDDGALAIVESNSKAAIHLSPDQALDLRDALLALEPTLPPAKHYTDEVKNLQAIAAIWAPIFGVPVTPEKVCLAMVGMKVAMAATNPQHRDRWTGIVGYAGLAQRAGFTGGKG